MSHEKFQDMEIRISTLLRFGVIFSGTLIFVGWMMSIKWTGNPFFTFTSYDEIPLRDLVRFYILRENWGPLMVLAGLASLISLPLIRVFLTMILFMIQKEWILTGVSALVLTGLIVSFFLGVGH